MNTLDSVLRDFGIGSMVPGMFFVLFWIADKNLHPRLRKQFSAFLLAKNVSPNVQYVAASFIDMMNVIFGPNPCSVRFMLRSFVTSTGCFGLMLGIYTLLNPNTFHGWWGTEALILTVCAGGICNLLPDYISVMESRLLISRMKDGRGIDVFICLILDFFLTTVIGIFAIFIYLLFFPNLYELFLGPYPADPSSLMADIWMIFPSAFLLDRSYEGLFGIIIYTTYLTSAWIWLYAITIILVKTRGVMRPFRKILPVKKRPFRSVGMAVFFPSIVIAVVLGRVADTLGN